MLYLSYPLSNGFEIEVHMTGYMIEPLRRVEFDSVRRKCEEVYRVAPCDDSEDYSSPILNIVSGPNDVAYIDLTPLKTMQFITLENEETIEITLPQDMFPDSIEFLGYRKQTMRDIDYAIVCGKYVGVHHFILAAIRDGIHNVRLCKPTSQEEYGLREINFKLYEGYKIGVYSLTNPYDIFEYYISDLLNLFGKYSAPVFQIMPSVGDQSWDHTREYFRDRQIIL